MHDDQPEDNVTGKGLLDLVRFDQKMNLGPQSEDSKNIQMAYKILVYIFHN